MQYFIDLREDGYAGPRLGPFTYIDFRDNGKVIVTWATAKGHQVPSLLGVIHEGRLKLNSGVVAQFVAGMVASLPAMVYYDAGFLDVHWSGISLAVQPDPLPELPAAAPIEAEKPAPVEQPLPDIRGLAQDLVRLAHKLGYSYDNGDWTKVPQGQVASMYADVAKLVESTEAKHAVDAMCEAGFIKMQMTPAFVEWLRQHRFYLFLHLASAMDMYSGTMYVAPDKDGGGWLLVWPVRCSAVNAPTHCHLRQEPYMKDYLAMVVKSHPNELKGPSQ